ncbi:DNA polymerase III, delta subunit [Treponema primitia ZAS-2]|uniref:DNA-directed DNA polymerase n=1 Tax=Treponema primitia (strain ATCC BAA-887 / DSM 12427 / ZAS-2) TaxID=545694 RepID=F5YK06_TREPZ|nr:DNA polymerase III subunit delta [Treponema primitia]AEF86481.1 DNA polymerase III, delta subunit [Treponema primitia ZAS-2]
MAKGNCLLFLGPEFGEKQDAIELIRKNLQKQYGAPPEEGSFYVGETAVNEMVSVLRNGSLFFDAQLFFIKNAELLKKKDDLELLGSYMAAPQEDTTLILISDNTSLDKALEKVVSKEGKRIFWELFENKKTEWVANFFRREGYRINSEGIEAILELVENNTDSLRRECSRLMLFLGKDEVVGETEVEKWLSHTREESAFTLFSRIAEGDLSRSAEILHTLLAAKETPTAILGVMAWCFRKLRDYIALTANGAPNDFEFRKIGLASTRVRKDYAAAGPRYGTIGADACLALTADFDMRIRSTGSGFAEVLMDLYLCKITGLAN